MEKGLIQIYTGDGKGKTTAAFGQAVRAMGRGMKVVIIQFLKGEETGEVLFSAENIPQLRIYRMNSQKKFFWTMNDSEKEQTRQEAKSGFEVMGDIIKNKKCDMLILDEILGSVHNGLVSEDELISLLRTKPENMEIILTGRGASPELIETADLVTEMKNIKHPYDSGITARLGIEK